MIVRTIPYMLAIAALMVASVALGTGCASGARAPQAEAAFQAPSQTMTPTTADAGRITHYTARQTVVVVSVPQAIAQAQAIATARSGYVLSHSNLGEREGWLHLKVSADQLEAALADLAALGRQRSRSIEGIDITEAFADTEARLATMRAARQRMMELYERATTVTEILAIQEHLDRLQENLDATEARMRVLRNQRDLADIYVTFERQRILGPLGLALRAISWTLQKLFVIQ